MYEKGWAEEALLVAEAQHEKSDKEDTEDENNALAGLELDKDEKPVISKEVKPRRKKRVVGEPWTTYGERTRFVWLRSLKLVEMMNQWTRWKCERKSSGMRKSL